MGVPVFTLAPTLAPMSRRFPRLASLALALLLGAAAVPTLRAQDAEAWKSAVSEAKAMLSQPDGADYEKRAGAVMQRLPLADAMRDCLRRNAGKAPAMINVVLVLSLDGTVRDALHPPNDPVSGCVAAWMNAQKGLPTPPRDAWMVHIQVKTRP